MVERQALGLLSTEDSCMYEVFFSYGFLLLHTYIYWPVPNYGNDITLITLIRKSMFMSRYVPNLKQIHWIFYKLWQFLLFWSYIFQSVSDNPRKKELAHFSTFTILFTVSKIRGWNSSMNFETTDKTFTLNFILPLPHQSMLVPFARPQKRWAGSTLISGERGEF